MTDRPKVVPLGTKDDMAALVENLRRNLPQLLEHAALIAQFRRAYFLALVKEGFTNEQALELCKHSMTL